MKSIYILVLLMFISCAKTKENKVAVDEISVDIQKEEIESVETKNINKTSLDVNEEDISGEYELVEGKSYDLKLETNVYHKSAIVFEKLSDTDYGYYYTDKSKDVRPIGYYGILRRIDNEYYHIDICDEDDVEGYSKDNFTNGIFINSKVKIITSSEELGMITYGGNFRKYMHYKKKKAQDKYHLSLVKELKSVQDNYKAYLLKYKKAKNYDKNKLEIELVSNNGHWKTVHHHKEDYAKFKTNHNSYQDPTQNDHRFVKLDADFLEEFNNSEFVTRINDIPTKSLPLIEDTNFDSFIDADDINEVDEELLRIENLYPNFYKEGYNYRAINSYKLEIDKGFYAIVITVKKGDHEMETTLINYDATGNIIDYQLIAYDEIAEGMFRTQSKITTNKLVINEVVWKQEPQIKQVTYQIFEDGIIDGLDSRIVSENLSNIPIINIALKELRLNFLDVKIELITSKAHPDNQDDVIVVIPEIMKDDIDYFELKTHILIINNRSGEVMYKLFDNSILSDVTELKAISIDTAPYLVSENQIAFGIRAHHQGESVANPYENELLSLFVKSGDALKKILHNCNVMQYGGESYEDCFAEFTRIKSILTMEESKTNGYFDIAIKSTSTDIKKSMDDNGKCNTIEKENTEVKVLKFNGATY